MRLLSRVYYAENWTLRAALPVLSCMLLLAIISGCGSASSGTTGSPPPPPPPTPSLSSITVGPTAPSIGVGGTQQFSATATYSDGSTKDVTGMASWTSSYTMTATVAPGGLATAISSGITTVSAAVAGITGTMPLFIYIPTTQTPNVTLYSNPTDPRLVTETLSDGSTINYFGTKDTNGLATSISSVVLTRTNGNSTIASYNAQGLPTTIHGSGGGTVLLQWTTAVQGTVTAISPDGKARVGPVPFFLQSAGSSARKSQMQSSRTLDAIRIREAALKAEDGGSAQATIAVSVSQCSGKPVQNATVAMTVATPGALNQLWPITNQSQPGLYSISFPIPSSIPTLTVNQMCGILDQAVQAICLGGPGVNAIASALGTAFLIATDILVPELAVLEILTAEVTEVSGEQLLQSLASDAACGLLNAPVVNGTTSPFEAGCMAAGNLVNEANSPPVQLTLSPYAAFPGGGAALPAPPQKVSSDDPSAAFTITSSDTSVCGTVYVGVTPNPAVVLLNNTMPLTAQAYDSDFNPVSDTFTWQSDMTSVAQVDPNSGIVSGDSLGTANITATASNKMKGVDPITVAAATFWEGTYTKINCVAPGYIGSGDPCAYVVISLDYGADGSYSGPRGLYARLGTTESSNIRIEHEFDTELCSATSGDISTANTFSDTYGLTGVFFSSVESTTLNFVVTSRLPTTISGTFSASFNYPLADNGVAVGTVTGIWSLAPRATTFPKCLTNGADMCTDNGTNLNYASGSTGPCPWSDPSSPAPPGEWQGIP